MSSFFDNVQTELNIEKIQTENGATAYSTSGKALLDINFAVSSLRCATDDEILSKYIKAYFEDPVLAVKWLFFARDVRDGMGERRLFRVGFEWLGRNHPDVAKKLLRLVSEYGRYDDLFCLVGTSLENDVFEIISEGLIVDNENMKAGKPVTLLAKWCPSVNTSSRKTVAVARKLVRHLGMDERTYRKTLSALRSYIDVTEVKTSSSRWSEIDYSKVSSQANLKYKDAFLRNDTQRRQEFLAKLEVNGVTINSSTAFPCDIVRQYRSSYNRVTPKDAALEGMWKSLPDYMKNIQDGRKNTIVVCDSSGSMLARVGNTNTTAWDVSLSLAVYFSERMTDCDFKDKFITFSSSPKLVDMKNCSSLHDKIEYIEKFTEYSSTNIEAVYDLILRAVQRGKIKNENIPNILVISDMHFDDGVYCSGAEDTLMEQIAEKWKDAGYEMPRCTYWNVCGGAGRSTPVPVQSSSSGIGLVSGFSPVIADMVLSGKMDPFGVLVEKLNSDRYSAVGKALAA